MISIPVRSDKGDYQIIIARGLLERAGTLLQRAKLWGKVMVVTQQKVASRHLRSLTSSLRKAGYTVSTHYLQDGEVAKSSKELFRIYDALLLHDFERRDVIFALGGGVVGDVAGFAASTYLRGLPFVNAGTTLLAQVDSAIGGKTGINLSQGKNLIGTFYPPRLVISDILTLKTLPVREFRASLAEVVKYGVIRDARLFRILETKSEAIVPARDDKLLECLVRISARIKALVVSRDEYEQKNERMILNFGHTFGHAFEQATDYRKFLHGEAVAIGMVCAARLAERLGLLKKSATERIEAVLRLLKLPTDLRGVNLDAEAILYAMGRDKKKRAGHLRFILPDRIGHVVIRDDIRPVLVRDVLVEAGARR